MIASESMKEIEDLEILIDGLSQLTKETFPKNYLKPSPQIIRQNREELSRRRSFVNKKMKQLLKQLSLEFERNDTEPDSTWKEKINCLHERFVEVSNISLERERSFFEEGSSEEIDDDDDEIEEWIDISHRFEEEEVQGELSNEKFDLLKDRTRKLKADLDRSTGEINIHLDDEFPFHHHVEDDTLIAARKMRLENQNWKEIVLLFSISVIVFLVVIISVFLNKK